MIDYEKYLPILASIEAAKMGLKDATDNLMILVAETMGIDEEVLQKIMKDMQDARGIK